jgi:hypothetical protein
MQVLFFYYLFLSLSGVNIIHSRNVFCFTLTLWLWETGTHDLSLYLANFCLGMQVLITLGGPKNLLK